MLQFIYTGSCNITGENAVDILVVANMYQLQRLKELSEKVIESGVDDENRLQLLQLSNIYRAMQLEELCAHAIVKMKEKEYNMLVESSEYTQLNDEIKLLIKRKRESRKGVLTLVNETIDDVQDGTEDQKKSKQPQLEEEKIFEPRIGILERIFTYSGPMDFHFSANAGRNINLHSVASVRNISLLKSSVPLLERLKEPELSTIQSITSKTSSSRRSTRRRKKSNTEKEIAALMVGSSFCFEAPDKLFDSNGNSEQSSQTDTKDTPDSNQTDSSGESDGSKE